jgi:hypothetical protein
VRQAETNFLGTATAVSALTAAVQAFSPVALFRSGEQGAWYDPSDLTSMRQLSTGDTAVTAGGDPVGFLADKRLMGGQTFAAFVAAQANAVTNGDFAVNTAGWVPAAGYTITRNAFAQAEIVRSSTTTPANGPKQTGAVVSGRFYVVELDVIALSNTVSVYLGSFSAATEALFSATGTGQQRIVQAAGGTDVILAATGASAATCTIDNIKIYDVPGNHATQATAAQRPTYGIVPATGRRNLLTRTEEFDNAVWVKTNTSVVANNATAPNGTLTADTVTSNAVNSLILQNYVFAAATHRFSIWLRRVSGTGVVEGTLNNFTYTQFSLTSTWQRFSFSHTTIAGNNGFLIRFGSSGDVVEMWGAQLELGSTTTDYQRVGTAFDVTEAGVASMSYLSFDGTDDSLSTGNITPGTDKAQVFAGVRKLSDAAIGMVAETSLNAGGGSAIQLRAPGSVADNYIFGSAGTLVSTVVANGFAAPITNVVTGLGDISADSAILRANGLEVANSTSDQGTGDFLTYPLYIGRRGGTSLPYNGQIYGLVVRFGTNLSAATVTQTETWLANRVAPTVVI